jgi:hypothetical protein
MPWPLSNDRKTQNHRYAKQPHWQQAPATCPLGEPSYTSITRWHIANQNGLRVGLGNCLNFSAGIDDGRAT